ncbi:MAG: glutamine--tRNA ligase/YqeY domain fusion protein [Bdellovibrionaceae bacterium]|nr:glutamine--tRNA ligase/YqeY domain fusion protein [Pseudobdellovibrionaceae bacterium]
MSEKTIEVSNFIRNIIDSDLKVGKNNGKVVTRFPPEPNGYLHIGHAKSICLNFGIARDYKSICHLRFDDTNPLAEDVEYVDSIQSDIQWLGFDWADKLFFASDYFDKLYNFAIQLIKSGKAYVDESSIDEIRQRRGSLSVPGVSSPSRDNSIEKNLELFEKMRSGEFAEGHCVLRAKIDMASSNMNLRDPILYRIRKVVHHRTGNKWQIYPMYDYTHPLSDMIEGITHSICTLEFEDHRPLYDWVLDELKTPCHPQQIEFARLNLDYTVMSKRKLLELVEKNLVNGWDDPRMPTISGMRRRGYTPQAIRNFSDRIGVTKKNSIISLSTLEHAVREDLDEVTPRAMVVIQPLKVVIENYPVGEAEELQGSVHPKKPELGQRQIPFTREIYIERDDFMENPPKDYFRLSPNGEVRLRYGYVIHCHEVIKNNHGEVVELRATYDKETKGGKTPEGKKKVKGIIHWVSTTKNVECEVRLYDRLFKVPDPLADKTIDFTENINADSLVVLKKAYAEPSLKNVKAEERFQFERLGFFCADKIDCKDGNLVFNRTVTLRDTWK